MYFHTFVPVSVVLSTSYLVVVVRLKTVMISMCLYTMYSVRVLSQHSTYCNFFSELMVNMIRSLSLLMNSHQQLSLVCLNGIVCIPVVIFFYAGFSARANTNSILSSVKVVVSMPQLLQLIPTVCLHEGCSLRLNA